MQLTDYKQLTQHETLKYNRNHKFRRCYPALLWGHNSLAVKTIATQLEVCQQCFSNWLSPFEQYGLVGLMCQKEQGRKLILSLCNTTHLNQGLTKP